MCLPPFAIHLQSTHKSKMTRTRVRTYCAEVRAPSVYARIMISGSIAVACEVHALEQSDKPPRWTHHSLMHATRWHLQLHKYLKVLLLRVTAWHSEPLREYASPTLTILKPRHAQ